MDFLNELFETSALNRVADIHFHRGERDCKVKLRIPGGALIQHKAIPIEWAQVIDEKIRAKSRITTTDHRTAQDGRFSLSFDKIEVDVRVAITPGVGDCQLIVCRLLIQSNSNIKLADIEIPAQVRDALRRMVDEPHGLLIVCGPTGSGKTTTLYAVLNELNTGTRNIVTVENPVEYRVPEFHQINIDNNNITFATALKTVLRQDPDVVMVGEIRDQETANIAVQAAMTGHLVVTTLHANSAAQAINRLVDMGVDLASLNGALRCVIAQRLVRTIAPDAVVTHIKADEEERIWMKVNGIMRHADTEYPRVINELSGYKGVAPVMEMIVADQRIRRVLDKGEAEILQEASRQPQFETLAQAAERLAYTRRTTLEEARHLTSGQDGQSINNRRLGQVLVAQGIVSSDVIDTVLEKQSALRNEGQHRRLGDLLIEQGYCNADQIHHAVGFTAEAKDILLRIATTEDLKQRVYSLAARWARGTTSLFEMAVSAQIVTEKEIYDAYDI